MEFVIINKKEILLNVDNSKREKEISKVLKSVIKSIEKIQQALKEKN